MLIPQWFKEIEGKIFVPKNKFNIGTETEKFVGT